MNLREDLLRGIYAYGFEKPSAIQSRGEPSPRALLEQRTAALRSPAPPRLAPLPLAHATVADPSVASSQAPALAAGIITCHSAWELLSA